MTIFLLTEVSPSANIYSISDCIKSMDYGDSQFTDLIPVIPIPKDCAEKCSTACTKQFSQIIQNRDINEDVVDQCMKACKNGETFSTYYRTIDTNTQKLKVVGPDSITEKCSLQYTTTSVRGAYNTQRKVQENDIFSIKMSEALGDNVIFLCGAGIQRLDPIFSSLDSQKWNDNTQWTIDQQMEWSDSNIMDLSCLRTTQSWNTDINNLALWDPSQSFGTGISPSKLEPNGRCKWSARNSEFTDTGVYLKDNDKLNITWYGDFSNGITGPLDSSNNNALEQPVTHYSLLKCMHNLWVKKDRSQSEEDILAYCQEAFRQTSVIEIAPANNTSSPKQIIGEDFRHGTWPIGPVVMSQSELEKKIDGVQGMAITSDAQTTQIQTPECSTQSTKLNPECNTVDKVNSVYYTAQWDVQDFGNSHQKLFMRHGIKDDNSGFFGSSSDTWEGNTGGFATEIKWGSCQYKDGDMLQYTIANSEADIKTWIDLNKEDFGKYITADQGGYIYFRIKPLSAPSGGNQEVADLYVKPGNSVGQYLVAVRYQSGSNIITGPIKTIVGLVRDTLLGTDGKSGVTMMLYSVITSKDNTYINLVRAMLTLYLMLYGLMFMAGIGQHDRKTVIMNVTKYATIVALTSPGGWFIISTYVMGIFVNGSIEIVGYIVNGATKGILQIGDDPVKVFDMFDEPVMSVISPQVGRKMVGLFCSGLFGAFMSIIVAVSIGYYLLSVIKVALIFIYALLGISFLIFMAPVMIPLALFQYTKQTFDSWWKYIISYSLQPVFLFAGAVIFNAVFMILLKSTLYFTVCPSCLWKIDLGDTYNECLIPRWLPLITMHTPTLASYGMTLPFNVLTSGICLLIIAMSMAQFSDLIVSLCGRMVTGSPARVATASGPVGGIDRSLDYAKGRLKATGKDTYNIGKAQGIKASRAIAAATTSLIDKNKK